MREVGVSSTSRAIRSQRSAAAPPPTTATPSVSAQNQKSSSSKQFAHVHVAFLLLGELEQLRRLELEGAGDHEVRERLQPDVVQLDGFVVQLTAVGDRLLQLRDA